MNMNSAKVSILVPIYKVEPFIERCACSLFEQTFENIEYVFVDDCSPDNSVSKLEEIIERYPHRKKQIKIVRNLKNSGIAEVRNILIANATGEYVLFVDSDDWVELTMVKELMDRAEVSNADIVCGDLIYEYEKSSEYYRFNSRDNKIEYLKGISSGAIGTYLFLLLTKRELYTANGLRFCAGINVCEDYIMYNKLFFHAERIEHLNAAFYHYFRGNPNSYTVLSIQNILHRIKAIETVEQYLKSNDLFVLLSDNLNRRKFETKKEFIVDRRFRDFEKWRMTFPESNYSWKNSNIGRRNKLACLLVSLHFDSLAKLFLK